MKKALLAGFVFVVMVFSTIAWCQGGPEGPGGPGGNGGPGGPGGPGGSMGASITMAVMPLQSNAIDRMSDTLVLTDDQITRLKDIAKKGTETLTPLNKAATEASKALREALLASTYDSANVAKLVTKAQKAESDVITASIAVWNQMRAVLTSDQIVQLSQAASSRPDGPAPQQ